MKEFVAGYIGGVAGLIIGSPLDIWKVRIQAAHNSGRAFQSWASLFRGLLAPVLGLGLLNAILFESVAEALVILSFVAAGSGPYKPSLLDIFIAGFVGGLCCFVVSAPTELVKCRQQVSDDSVDENVKTPSTWTLARVIVAERGLLGLYQGGWITLWRDSVGYGFYFLAYEAFKIWLPHLAMQVSDSSVVLVAGGIAGCVSWATIYPLDVVKTRMQVDVPPDSEPLLGTLPHPSSGYTSIWDCTEKLYLEGGISIFFRGSQIVMFRAFLVNSVTFFVYEWVKALWERPQ